MFTQKNGFLHFHYWKFNKNVVATHVALSLPVVTVKEKKSYNPVCWLLSLAEDWTVLGLFNDIPSRVFSTFKKKKVVVKFLWPYNIFYSDGIFFVCPSVIFFFVFFLPFLQYKLLCSQWGLWWLNLFGNSAFPFIRKESLMLVKLTVFYFCSLYLRFNKNLLTIHCHFFPTCSRVSWCADFRLDGEEKLSKLRHNSQFRDL